jgi:hypothetical protein
MTVIPPCVVVPYTEFLARRERRCAASSELSRHGREGAIAGEVVAVAAATPSLEEQNVQDQRPCRVLDIRKWTPLLKEAARAT